MREFHGKIPNTFNFKEYLYYFSRMKAFFDVSHITPEEGDEFLLQTAIEIAKGDREKIKKTYDKNTTSLVFFVENYIEPGGKFYYEEEAKNCFVSLINVLEEILEYIRTYVTSSKISQNNNSRIEGEF